jgi:hypothetical protein
MQTEEVDLIQIEMTGGPNPLWLTFLPKGQPIARRICAPARNIVRIGSPNDARDPEWLYLLVGDTLLIVEADQFRTRMREAAAVLRNGGTLAFAQKGALYAPPTRPRARAVRRHDM